MALSKYGRDEIARYRAAQARKSADAEALERSIRCLQAQPSPKLYAAGIKHLREGAMRLRAKALTAQEEAERLAELYK